MRDGRSVLHPFKRLEVGFITKTKENTLVRWTIINDLILILETSG